MRYDYCVAAIVGANVVLKWGYKKKQISTYFVVARQDLVVNFQLTILQMSDVQNIPIKHLDIGYLEVCDAINYDIASVIFLTT